VQTGVVSDNFFEVMGVKPLYGRLFRPGEEAVGAPPVVLLSYQYWVNVMGSDPSAVGSTFVMNDHVHTVVGILPPLPTYPNANDIWMPAGACPFRSAPAAMASRTARLPTVFARLKPGVSLDRARTELQTIDTRLRETYAVAYPVAQQLRSAIQPIKTEMTSGSMTVLLMLFSTAVFLMLAAAANFASLTLARHARRAREFAVREALGSGSWRLYRQLALESLILTAAAGVVGTAVAASGVGLLRTFATQVTPRAGEIGINAPVIAFTLATCIVVGLAVAAVPFLNSARGTGLVDRLRQGNSGAMSSRAEGRLRRAFVVAQVCVAFVLLIGAGLVGQSLLKLERVDGGFDPASVFTARLTLNFTKYNTNELARAFADQLLQGLSAIPGTRSVAISNTFPLNGRVTQSIPFRIAGQDTSTGGAAPKANGFSAVSPAYFATVGIPLLKGRVFTAADRDTVTPPVIVSQRLATTYWKGQDPIGRTVSFDNGKTWNPIVGVVGDVRQNGLDQDVTDHVYAPVATNALGDIRVLIRSGSAAAPLLSQLRAIVRTIDDHQPITSVQTLDEVRGARLTEPRLRTTLVLTFSFVALLLAGAGLAGVVGYSVSQRIPEIAIRLALGAGRAHVVGLVSREGLAVVLIGVVVGTGIAAALARFVKALLFEVQPGDAFTYALVSSVILLTTAVACFVPARRALAADPALALRAS
jgi:predicted permease